MRGDWVAEEEDQPWLPDFDVRAVVAKLPSGPVAFDDFTWGEALHDDCRLPRIRDALHRLDGGDVAAAGKALSQVRGLTCDDGTTSVYGAAVVPALLRMAADRGAHLRGESLEFVGDLARMDITRHELRAELLWMMGPLARYDAWGYLENWAVEAVRMMVGRDADLLIALLSDDDPHVRGSAAYAVVAVLPARQGIVDALRARLVVEVDAAVQMILVVGIAQYERDQDRDAAAVVWAQTLWSDSTASIGVRLGGVIAWLGLTSVPPPTELQSVMDEMSMSTIYDLLRRLPWIWRLNYRAGGLVTWWQDMTQIADPPHRHEESR